VREGRLSIRVRVRASGSDSEYGSRSVRSLSPQHEKGGGYSLQQNRPSIQRHEKKTHRHESRYHVIASTVEYSSLLTSGLAHESSPTVGEGGSG
jgi:hypothetical protein